MTKASWLPPLTKAVSQLSPKSDLAQFRNEYSEIVRSIKDDPKNKYREILIEAGPLIESWVTQEDKCPCCALREWSNFYEKAARVLPLDVLVLFAKRLPQMKPGAVDWQPFFFDCRHKSILVAIYDRKFIGKANLQSWIADKLQSAYLLPVLDVAIENDAIPDHRALWNGCIKWGDRPTGLYSREELLAVCLSRAPAGTLEKELNLFLFDNRSARRRLFTAALGLPPSSVRLAEILASSAGTDRSDSDSLINDFVDACTEHARIVTADLPHVTLTLASLRIFLAAKGGGRTQIGDRIKLVDAASMQLASRMLSEVEEDPSSQCGVCVSALSAIQLHDIVHRHLNSLATASSNTSGPADRSSKYERHLGKKEVLDKVLNALVESADAESLRESLEVALFNLGVRPLGNVGDRTKFESRLHDCQESGVVPGDVVEIITAGRCLGKGEELLVLVKAKVRRVSS